MPYVPFVTLHGIRFGSVKFNVMSSNDTLYIQSVFRACYLLKEDNASIVRHIQGNIEWYQSRKYTNNCTLRTHCVSGKARNAADDAWVGQ